MIIILGIAVIFAFWMIERYMTRFSMVGKLITKGVLIYVSLLGCVISVLVLIASISIVLDTVRENSVDEKQESIDHYYYNGRYAELRDTLSLYKCYEEDFDMYWELAEAGQLRNEYYMYEQIADRNKTMKEQCQVLMKECREKILEIQQNSEFPQNAPPLAYYADCVK